MDLDDPDHVRAQYTDETRVTTRAAVWRGTDDGRWAQDVIATVIAEAWPRRVLDVGCGTGEFAGRLRTELPRAQVLAVDQSARLARLTAHRGVPVAIGDVCALPLPDDSVDVAAAL